MKYYQLFLSNKEVFEIDEKDLAKIETAIESGNLARIKPTIVNPSFIVNITPIKKEPTKKIEGYVDEKSGKFIATTYEEIEPKIENEFKEKPKQLSDKFKVA